MVAALFRLVASGDHVRKVTGTFSGTLGFLVSGTTATAAVLAGIFIIDMS